MWIWKVLSWIWSLQVLYYKILLILLALVAIPASLVYFFPDQTLGKILRIVDKYVVKSTYKEEIKGIFSKGWAINNDFEKEKEKVISHAKNIPKFPNEIKVDFSDLVKKDKKDKIVEELKGMEIGRFESPSKDILPDYCKTAEFGLKRVKQGNDKIVFILSDDYGYRNRLTVIGNYFENKGYDLLMPIAPFTKSRKQEKSSKEQKGCKTLMEQCAKIISYIDEVRSILNYVITQMKGYKKIVITEFSDHGCFVFEVAKVIQVSPETYQLRKDDLIIDCISLFPFDSCSPSPLIKDTIEKNISGATSNEMNSSNIYDSVSKTIKECVRSFSCPRDSSKTPKPFTALKSMNLVHARYDGFVSNEEKKIIVSNTEEFSKQNGISFHSTDLKMSHFMLYLLPQIKQLIFDEFTKILKN